MSDNQWKLAEISVIILGVIIGGYLCSWLLNSANSSYMKEYAQQIVLYNKYCHPKQPLTVEEAQLVNLNVASEVRQCIFLFNTEAAE